MGDNMKLLRGKFLVNNINEVDVNAEGIQDVIELAFMGKYEYEGNAIPVSRMTMEYNKDNYVFYPFDIYSNDNQQLFAYLDMEKIKIKQMEDPNYLDNLIKHYFDTEYFLPAYIYHNPEERHSDFWWDLNRDLFLFYGEEKKAVIEYFINRCNERDGSREMIKAKLLKAGYELIILYGYFQYPENQTLARPSLTPLLLLSYSSLTLHLFNPYSSRR